MPERQPAALAWLMLAPALVLTAVLVVALAWMAESSLHLLDRSTFMPAPERSLANYVLLAERPVYWRILGKTLLAAVLVTAITLVLAFPYAWAMVRTASAGWRKVLLISLFLPFFLGQVVRAYGWLIVLGKQGLLNSALAGLGLPAVEILYTYPGVLLGLVQYMLPFAVLLLAPAMTAIPEEIELAAASLGARPWATLTTVLLPLAKPGLVAAGIVVFTLTLTDFAMPEIMGGGTTDFMANAIYDGFFQLGDSGLGGALAVVLTALGSLLVAVAFTALGLGTLAYVQREAR